jgi:hypothetical protein
MQRNLDAHLDGEDEAEEAVAQVEREFDAQHIDDDLFERDDGTRFRVLEWPSPYQDYDEDGPCGCAWTSARIEDVETEEEETTEEQIATQPKETT